MDHVLPTGAGLSGRPAAGHTVLSERPMLAVLVYLLTIAASEALVERWRVAGLVVDVMLLPVLLFHGARTANLPLRGLLWALSLPPLVRIIGLALPLAGLPLLYAIAIVSVPTLVAALVAAWALGYSPRDIGLTLSVRWLPVAVLMLPLGLTIGVLQYGIVRPEPLARSLDLSDVWIPALILLLGTGFVEELIYRGVVLRAAVRLMGAWAGILLTTALFTFQHLGYQSPIQLGIAAGAGLLFGIVAYRGNSILGPALAHAGINIGLFIVAPYILPMGVPATVRPAPPAQTSSAPTPPPAPAVGSPSPLPTEAPFAATSTTVPSTVPVDAQVETQLAPVPTDTVAPTPTPSRPNPTPVVPIFVPGTRAPQPAPSSGE